ncbi:hypothetical protein V1514DRAFT_351231 [Lipomyces japonicus]|uniref:uncharacterized protein n=1 Tax=Lipomyces japonicus TaxID=56871 RepID=UPI0034CEFB0D
MQEANTNHSIPTAREKKYDRQLRLWAANGQAALEEAHVLLVTASAAGAEILKNLVLPGTGTFTIADDKLVTQQDVDVNFFLDEDSIGHSRAKKVTELLQELNQDSTGISQILNLKELDQIDPSYWESFSLVVAHQIRPDVLIKLSSILWENKIPLVVSRSIGFYASLRLVVPEHTVVESHPDSTVELRLDSPWPELEQLAESVNLDELDDMEHAHVPYVILLLKYLKKWKQEHNGDSPSNYAEKNQFKQLIKAGIRTNDPENFEEAINAVWRASQKTEIPSSIKKILGDKRAQELTETSTKFWILARAVADFVLSPESDGHLPLSGTLPDMKADSASYIALQNVYRDKAQKDRNEVERHAHRHLQVIGRSTDSISREEIETFAKFSSYLFVIDGRSVEEEYLTNPRSSTILNGLDDSDDLTHIYVGFRAVDLFEQKFDRYPGLFDDTKTDDSKELAAIALNLVKNFGGEEVNDRTLNILQEFVRAGGGELHNISSLLGGIGAQEIVKILTKQYIPINNTVIFDGIQSKSQVLQL